ncbi:hypothetical protein G7046_g1223 [Stylonectria norvegica]|nr:hypothetical protein G7046_g1223 [Stylonectria norvegica]
MPDYTNNGGGHRQNQSQSSNWRSRNSRPNHRGPVVIQHPAGGEDHVLDMSRIEGGEAQRELVRHCQKGRWVDPSTLEFGDVANICVSNDALGVSLRYCQFWKMAMVDGRKCPLFLVQITNGKLGPRDGAIFFQTDISFILEDRPERSVFVNVANVVAIVPPEDHGKIFLQMHVDRKGSERECVLLRAQLDHLVNDHPGLLQLLCAHVGSHKETSAAAFAHKSTTGIKAFIQKHGRESCRKPGCTLCKSILSKATSSLANGVVTGRGGWSKNGGGGGKKILPYEELCHFLTGNGKHFNPAAHRDWQESGQQESELVPS